MEDRLLKILVCPETKQALTLAPIDVLAALNAQIASCSVTNRRGQSLTEPLEALLIREDRQVGYPVRGSIPELLIDEAIPL